MPVWRQTIIWTNAAILLIEPLGTNFSQILMKIQRSSYRKRHFKMHSAKYQPFWLSLNLITYWGLNKWWTFCRQHFQMHFLDSKLLYFDLSFPDFCSYRSNWQFHKSSRWWLDAKQIFYSLWPNDTICWHTNEPTLARVMACCLMMLRHYLNQCRLIIRHVQW